MGDWSSYWNRGEGIVNVRPLNERKYNISKHRFAEVYHFCLQYSEWKDELKYKMDNLNGVQITDMPTSHSNESSVETLAIRRAALEGKCKVIEQTAIETDSEIYQYIIKAVTNEFISYNYLYKVMDIPCGKKMYYDRRRKFYYLLSQKL